MKKTLINSVHLEGWLYQHNLEKKVSGENSKHPGTEFITGTIDIATNDDLTNIVTVHYTYITAVTAKGKQDARFNTLSDIISGVTKNVMKDGKDNAAKVRVDTAIDLNEFYSDRNGTEELVSAKRNEGGFIHIVNEISDNEAQRNYFDEDMIITGVRMSEGDPEKGTSDKAIIKGFVFNFTKALLPVEFSATTPGAISYFMDTLAPSKSNPCFTRIKGTQVSETICKTITEESAFDGPSVKEVKSSRKDFVVTWAQPDPYAWDSEETITVAELKEALANREITVAAIKKRQDDYKASKGQGAPASAAVPSEGAFDF